MNGSPPSDRPFARLATNSFFAAISEASVGFLFLLFILAARFLGDAQFGVFSFALAFVNIFGVLNDLGMRYVYVREVSRDQAHASRYLANVLLLQLGLSTLTLGVVFVGINLLDKDPQTLWVVYLLAGAEFLRSLKFLFRFVFRAVDHFELETVTVLFERIALFAVGLGVLLLGYQVLVFALAFLVVRLVDVLLSVFISTRWAVRPGLRADFDLWQHLLRKSAPFALSGVVMLLFFKVSTVLLSVVGTDAEVGWYSAAYKLIEGLVLFPAIFSSSLYPSISRLHNDRAMVLSLAQRGIKYIFLAALPLTVIGFTLADQIVLTLFGQEYVNAILVLRIVLLALAFMYLRDVGGSVLAAIDLQKESFIIATIILVVNIAANLILTPRFGYLGAAAATAGSEILFGVSVAGYLWYRGYRLPYLQLALKPLLAAVLMAVLVKIVDLPLLPALALGSLGYLLVVSLLSVWDEREIALFRQVTETVGSWIGSKA